MCGAWVSSGSEVKDTVLRNLELYFRVRPANQKGFGLSKVHPVP